MRRTSVALVAVGAVLAAACSHGPHPKGATSSSTTTSTSSAPAAPATDTVYNILPPGEYGGLPPDANSTDQLALYDGLTPLRGNVTTADISKYFKPEVFGLDGQTGRPEAVPRPGLTIVRDSWDVPHITGATRADVEFGAGWVTAEDRGIFIEAIRGPARLAAI
ncbi:MAG TPA: penicillin acylase family protein, partial [Acidimicrobiales bacterium]|nr:penicillin acylase family protein [Acidimicrobiales bacterium]